jgi:hypothetical protein
VKGRDSGLKDCEWASEPTEITGKDEEVKELSRGMEVMEEASGTRNAKMRIRNK